MPFILKPPVEDSKGIIIFTHKERDFINPSVPFMAEAMQNLKDRYVLGMHWGSPHYDVDPVPLIDFHLGGQGTLRLKETQSAPHIPMCSRNFLPPCFHKQDVTKYWDIIAVAGPRRLKKLDELLVVLSKLIKRRPETRALIITACEQLSTRDPELDYVEIYDDYMRLFTPEERSKITLMLLEGQEGMSLSQETLSYFYNASKLFTMFTNKEGESRVIHEALLCGLPVVVKKHLEGGGRDYLDETNSRQFGTLDEAVEVFIDALDHYEQLCFDTQPLMAELSTEASAKRLQAEMEQIFLQKGLPFKGEMDTEHLSFKLPGHRFLTLPLEWRSTMSNDLNSPESTLLFIHSLLDKPVSFTQRAQLRLYHFIVATRKNSRQFFKSPARVFRRAKILPPKKNIQRATNAYVFAQG